MYNKDFIDLTLSKSNIDLYYQRSSILEAINKNLIHFKGKLLDAGCGKMPYIEYILEKSKVTKYIGLDIESAKVYDVNIKPDFLWDGKKMPFEDQSFDCVFATEVLEHVPQPSIFLQEAFRVLKKRWLVFFYCTLFMASARGAP